MRFPQEGEGLVSTPVYAGSIDQVREAARCGHQFEPSKGQPEGIEKCGECVATRVRIRPAQAAGISRTSERRRAEQS